MPSPTCLCGHPADAHHDRDGCTTCACHDTPAMVAHDAWLRGEVARRPVIWSCPRCLTDHRSGSPNIGCDDCGWRAAS